MGVADCAWAPNEAVSARAAAACRKARLLVMGGSGSDKAMNGRQSKNGAAGLDCGRASLSPGAPQGRSGLTREKKRIPVSACPTLLRAWAALAGFTGDYDPD